MTMVGTVLAPSRPGPRGREGSSAPIPDNVADKLADVGTAGNLRVVTWGVLAFGGLQCQWVAGLGDSPQRDRAASTSIAVVRRHVDVDVMWEARRGVTTLPTLGQFGPRWQTLCSDVNEGDAGNGEQSVCETDRAKPSCRNREIVLPTSHAGMAPSRPATAGIPDSTDRGVPAVDDLPPSTRGVHTRDNE